MFGCPWAKEASQPTAGAAASAGGGGDAKRDTAGQCRLNR